MRPGPFQWDTPRLAGPSTTQVRAVLQDNRAHHIPHLVDRIDSLVMMI